MATQTNTYSPWLPETRAGLFHRLGRWIVRMGEASWRRDEIEALENMSDAELARLGITRDRILYYVFRDKFWL